MALRNYLDIIGPLVIPIGPHEYTIPPIDAAMGIKLKLAQAGKKVPPELAALSGEDWYRLFLGPAFDQMVKDDVEPSVIERAYFTAMADFRNGRDTAERTWEAGLDPEVMAALREAAAKAAKRKNPRASTPSPSTAAASSTRTRAATSGTTSRPATPRRAAKATKAAASNGRRSSTSSA